MDLEIREFKENLISVINNSHLPPSVAFYVLKDVLLEVQSVANQAAEEQKVEHLEKPEIEVKTNE